MLSIQEYEERESAAADLLPNRVIEMINPVVFASEGYPMRVRHEKVLWRYFDVMHETRFEGDFNLLHDGGITDKEFAWLKDIAGLACDLSRELFGRALTTRGSLSRAMHVFRSVLDVVGGEPKRVFEIGPGSGYLGALFIRNGWSYGATDITQAFYLLQNRLWTKAAGGKLTELAESNTWNHQLERTPTHVPWWEFFKLPSTGIPECDVVTCNHALAEMHVNSLAFTLRVAKEMLRGEGQKFFVFEGWGFEKLVSRQVVFENFVKAGFTLVHADGRLTVFSPTPTVSDAKNRIVPGGTVHKPIQGPDSSIYLPNNSISPRILSGRASRKAHIRHRLADVAAYYEELLGTKEVRTEDEQFLDWIGRNYH